MNRCTRISALTAALTPPVLRMSLMKRVVLCLLLNVLWISTMSESAYPSDDDEINEEELFSDTETVVDTRQLENDNLDSRLQRLSVDLTGHVYNRNYCSVARDDYILKTLGFEAATGYDGYLAANLLLDVRYRKGIKGFVNADLEYYFRGLENPADNNKKYVQHFFREMFVDFNIRNAVYFRAGRQYIRWGRNYLWNPTDLINVDRREFLDPNKNLQGTNGIRIHAPFGTGYNIYGFIDLEDAGGFRDIAWAGKFEFMAGNTEMAFSGWYKRGFKPVFGYDFSTRFFRIDWRGELSLSHGENIPSLHVSTDESGLKTFTPALREKGLFPKASLGFTKTFDLFNVHDRVSLMGEFYFNRAGYGYNVFKEPDSLAALMRSGLYEPRNVSRYYGSLFTTVQRFFVSDAVFNFNILTNLIDRSGVVYSSLRYSPRYDTFIEVSYSMNYGSGADEFTFAGNGHRAGIEVRYSF